MRFEKHVVHEMRMPYALGTLGPGPHPAVACGTEDHGPLVRIDPPYRQAGPMAAGPGGCMGVTYDPASPSDAWAIFGCFVGYDFQGGGLYRIRTGAEPERVLDLPYAHRLGFLEKGGRRLLVAASLAGHKQDASDWSTPGAVVAAEAAGAPALEPVLTGIHKNHGFLVAMLDGRRSLLIGGSEGLLAADLEAPGPGWSWRQVLPGETSEVALADLDGDGRDELVTIEPFHGNTLRGYRRTGSGWSAFWEAELQFGHGLWAGAFRGRPSVLVSSRAGAKDLLLFSFEPDAPARAQRVVVEGGAGAANALVVQGPGGDGILSANQAAGQIVLYTPRE